MVRMQIRLTEEQAQGLRRLAKRHGTSVAEIIRRAVGQSLEEDDLWDKAMNSFGCCRSGSRDVSTRHDEYLVEAYGEWLSADGSADKDRSTE